MHGKHFYEGPMEDNFKIFPAPLGLRLTVGNDKTCLSFGLGLFFRESRVPSSNRTAGLHMGNTNVHNWGTGHMGTEALGTEHRAHDTVSHG